MKKIRKNLLPKPEKMWKRAMYEIMWGGPHRDYGKYVGLEKKKSDNKSK